MDIAQYLNQFATAVKKSLSAFGKDFKQVSLGKDFRDLGVNNYI